MERLNHKDFFSYPKLIDFFLNISKDGIIRSTICKETDITYSHSMKYIAILENFSLTRMEKRDGRSKYIILTDKGTIIQNKLSQFVKELEN